MLLAALAEVPAQTLLGWQQARRDHDIWAMLRQLGGPEGLDAFLAEPPTAGPVSFAKSPA